jgi:hypothetical protein
VKPCPLKKELVLDHLKMAGYFFHDASKLEEDPTVDSSLSDHSSGAGAILQVRALYFCYGGPRQADSCRAARYVWYGWALPRRRRRSSSPWFSLPSFPC